MKIAAIVVTYNDDYKFFEWLDHYKKYRESIYKYIIVDNGSEKKYISMIEENFKGCKLIKRKNNGGSTAAYNDGIKYALTDPKVDSILLIGNDIKIDNKSIENLYKFLMNSNNNFDMVSPVLLEKDSNIISDFGCEIPFYLYMKSSFSKKKIDDLDIEYRTVESVTGGMNLAKTKFYKIVGLQDEKLFMYSDEVDMALRARKKDLKFGVTKNALAWHQHINPQKRSRRLPYSAFLIGRNKVYLAWKHFNFFYALFILLFQFIKASKETIQFKFKSENIQYNFVFCIGAIYGFFKIMKPPKWLKLN